MVIVGVDNSGLGTLGRDPCAPSPAWCPWVPFSDYMEECHPIDPVACQKSEFGPAMTPENRAAALAAGQASQDAYLRMNPDMAKAWDDWQKMQWVYKLEAPPALPSDTLLYGAIAAAIFAGLLLVRG